MRRSIFALCALLSARPVATFVGQQRGLGPSRAARRHVRLFDGALGDNEMARRMAEAVADIVELPASDDAELAAPAAAASGEAAALDAAKPLDAPDLVTMSAAALRDELDARGVPRESEGRGVLRLDTLQHAGGAPHLDALAAALRPALALARTLPRRAPIVPGARARGLADAADDEEDEEDEDEDEADEFGGLGELSLNELGELEMSEIEEAMFSNACVHFMQLEPVFTVDERTGADALAVVVDLDECDVDPSLLTIEVSRDTVGIDLQDEVRVNMELPAPVARERTYATFFEATGELRVLMPLLSTPKGFGEGERTDS